MKHLARKRFGQNFLVDAGIIASILKAVDASDDDLLVEIGPGLGALTEPLLAARPQSIVHAVELDRDLVKRLRGRYSEERLVVHQADALMFDFSSLASVTSRLRIVGNLPYNISTPLLFHLLRYVEWIVDQHFMLQKEVVERMVASPSTAAFGRLSVMLQARYDMEELFEVPPTAFDPAPKVYSAVVRMIPLGHGANPISDADVFSKLVAAAFSQRRKMLRTTLGQFDRIVPMTECGLIPTARAEDIPTDVYVKYANAIARLVHES